MQAWGGCQNDTTAEGKSSARLVCALVGTAVIWGTPAGAAVALTPAEQQAWKDLEKGTRQINQFVKTATDAAKNFEFLKTSSDAAKKFDNLMVAAEGLSALTKASAILGVFGAGIDLIRQLSGAPSDTQRILDAVGDVQTGIQTLDNRIKTLFSETFNKLSYESLASDVSDDLSSIENDYDVWTNAQGLADPSASVSLKDLNVVYLRNHAKSLHDHCTGANLKKNLFPTLEAYSHGDLEVATAWGVKTLLRIAQAKIAHTGAARVRLQKQLYPGVANDQLTDAQEMALKDAAERDVEGYMSPTTYDAMLSDCQQAFEASKHRILQDVDTFSLGYINVFLIGFDPQASEADKKTVADVPTLNSAADFGSRLLSKYPQQNWLVVIYDPIYGSRPSRWWKFGCGLRWPWIMRLVV